MGTGKDAFEPCYFFFYGTLMDSDVLRAVAGLRKSPKLQNASLKGFEMRMWNDRYPTVLPAQKCDKTSKAGKIKGKIWRATSMKQFVGLQQYETSAYEPCECIVKTQDGQSVKALTFKWAKSPDSAELSDGTFDLEHWQKTHKPGMFG